MQKVSSMGTRSVRLDNEAEDVLSEILKRTGMSISDAIKQGLIAYREKAKSEHNQKPSDFFQSYDLGEGGYSIGSARQSKIILKEKIKARNNK